MTRQSCGGKRMAAQVPAKTASQPAVKQARKRASTQGQPEDFMPPQVLDFMKKNGITKANLKPVLEVVQHTHTGLPQEVRDMLLATLPWSLAAPADKRHESQRDVVLMVDSVVGVVQAELQRALDVETSKVDELKAQQVELADAAERAEAASSVARGVVENQEKVVAQASSEVVLARKALEFAECEDARLGAELSQTRSLMLELEETISGSFRRLKSAEFEDGEADGLVQIVMAACAKSGLEEALVTTLPSCLAKRERGSFGQTVIGEAEQCIQGKIAALSEGVAASAAPVEAQAEVVREARVARDAAVAEQGQVADRLCGAKAESVEAVARAEAAKVTAAEFDAKLAPALELQGARQGELDHFRSYNLVLFEQMRDRTTEKDVAEKPVGAAAGAVLPASLAGA